ncbi:MAG: AmmeMemoRadiSam system protein B [Bifidobacteriaceae bacterium]|jgi:AmmeMemoRadiSam system protein B|nr:AmmeMemoRadiSam system protein B [Bifidobacteriaceae bacterium]
MRVVRQPAVAGQFYPATPGVLSAQVNQLLEDARERTSRRTESASPDNQVGPAVPAKALLVPHAGYQYSGLTAAFGYASLDPACYSQVVLLGPCHRVGTPFTALPRADYFRTPLGDVPVWQEGVALVRPLPQVVTGPEVHQREHSLEVHLPFIQTVLPPGTPVLPLLVGWSAPEVVAEVIETLWHTPRTLFIISSDLSHYLPYGQAKATDQAALEQIMAGGPALTGDQACGAFPLNGWLAAVQHHPVRPRLIDYRNSGDTAGDRSAVVGYPAMTFTSVDPGGPLGLVPQR